MATEADIITSLQERVEKRALWHRNWYARKGRAAQSARVRKQKYGISAQEVTTILIAQNFACALCELPLEEKFNIDHNHETGKVRGILCHQCNVGIGLLMDDSELLCKAAEYVKR